MGIGGQVGRRAYAGFATNNTVVDIMGDNSSGATVVLMDANGVLCYRSVAEDSNSPKYNDLRKVAVATASTRPAATGPATGPGRTPPPLPGTRTPPPPPPPTTNTRTPPPPPHY